MGNGEWGMGNGEWGIGNGELVLSDSCRLVLSAAEVVEPR